MSPETFVTLSFQAFQFSAVSSDSLTSAIQLAKRDLKQKRLEESLRSSQALANEKSLSPKSTRGKNKIVHSKEYKDKLKKRQGHGKQVCNLGI